MRPRPRIVLCSIIFEFAFVRPIVGMGAQESAQPAWHCGVLPGGQISVPSAEQTVALAEEARKQQAAAEKAQAAAEKAQAAAEKAQAAEEELRAAKAKAATAEANKVRCDRYNLDELN